MTTSNQRFAQLDPFSLAGAGAVIGDTSITLQSFTTIDGVALTMTSFGNLGYGTLEPGNGTLEEQISFTGITQNLNGTATLTGVYSVGFIYPYTSVSGLTKTHAGSTSFIISNTAGFYSELASTADDETITGLYNFPAGVNNPTIGTTYTAPTLPLQIPTKQYVDGVAIAGAPNATTTQAGIVLLSVNPISGTGIAVTTNDPRVQGYASGTILRIGDAISGTVNTGHGLGVTPRLVRFSAMKNVSSGTIVLGNGTSDGTAQNSISITAGQAVTGTFGYSTSNCLLLADTNGNNQAAVCTLSSSDITLTWTKTGTPSSDVIVILWEAYA